MADILDYPDALWTKGVNSYLEGTLLKQGEYQWATNVDNAGGVLSTRAGFAMTGNMPNLNYGVSTEPQGIKIFKGVNGTTSMVVAAGGRIYAAPYPFDALVDIGAGFPFGKVYFCKTVRSAKVTVTNGEFEKKEIIAPIPYLIMQNGEERAIAWDGLNFITSDPTDKAQGIPIGRWMQWSGSRLWVATGDLLHASDLADPLTFSEERSVAGGGTIAFSDDITGMFQTPDLSSLLVGTDMNMSAIKSGVFDRLQWGSTNEFLKIILPGIGVAAGDSFCHQFGVTWWYSHSGLTSLDQALFTYRTSRIKARDNEMMRSKSNMNRDISGIICRSFGNYLIVAVPSGSDRNDHIWALDQRGIDIEDEGDSSSWVSNWVGLSVTGMESAVINGEQRIFALSRDKHTIGSNMVYANPWELFHSEKEDYIPYGIISGNGAASIPCEVETRYLGMSKELKKFEWAEIELAELRGLIHVQVYASSRRGGYNLVLDKQISAEDGNINSNILSSAVTKVTQDAVPNELGPIYVESTDGFLDNGVIQIAGTRVSYYLKQPDAFFGTPPYGASMGDQVTQPTFYYSGSPGAVTNFKFESFLPQRRIIRTSSFGIGTSAPTESTLPDNVDRAFSLLIRWTGKLSITGIRLAVSPWDDSIVGKCEPDELKARSLDSYGSGSVSTNIAPEPTLRLSQNRRKYMRVITPKFGDLSHNSFFTASHITAP